MRAYLAIAFAAFCSTAWVESLDAAAFTNLDFEQATIASAPPNYEPWDAYEPISAAKALPGWTVTEDTTICNAIWGAPDALDETSVALVSSTNPDSYPPIAGSYAVELSAIDLPNVPPEYFKTSSISQTGFIPLFTKSIHFQLQIPPSAAGFPVSPTVMLGNQVIPVFVQSQSNGIYNMAGDVSGFAGLTTPLTFECISIPSIGENEFEIDSISFSTTPAPEPGIASALAFALSAIIRRPRHQK